MREAKGGRGDRACLWALVSRFLHESHLCPGLQIFKIRLRQNVPVKIDLTAIGHHEESIALLRKSLDNSGVQQ